MARLKISDMLAGGMSGAGAMAPAASAYGPAAPWIIGGGAAMGALSGLFGEEDPTDKLSRQLMGEQLIAVKAANAENARDAMNKRKLEARNKTISAGLGNLMRGANIARKIGGF